MTGKTEFRGTREAQSTVKHPNDAGQSIERKTGETPPDTAAWHGEAWHDREESKKLKGPSNATMTPVRAETERSHGMAWRGTARRGGRISQESEKLKGPSNVPKTPVRAEPEKRRGMARHSVA